MNTIDATTRQQYRRHLWQAGGKAAGWWHAALGVPRGCAGKECAARKLTETETVNGTGTTNNAGTSSRDGIPSSERLCR